MTELERLKKENNGLKTMVTSQQGLIEDMLKHIKYGKILGSILTASFLLLVFKGCISES